MTIQIEDILSIACSTVKLTHSNDFQKVFLLSTASEARLAFDVLVAYGFDVKAYYQDEDDSCKLYITHPTLPPDQLEEILSAAKAYTTTLKQIKQNLDQLCTTCESSLGSLSYNMTFANSQANAKQVIIQIAPPAGADAPSANEPTAIAQTASTITSASPKQRMKAKNPYEEFSSGPSVGRGKYPGAKTSDGSVREETIKRRVMLYLFGNMATSSFAMLVLVIILGIVFSLFVFAKAFLCPDFVSMKRSSAWYCQNSSNEDDAEQKKQQRQTQIGLPPVTEPR